MRILGWFENFGVVYSLSTSDDKPLVGESRHNHLQHAFKGHPSRLERVSTELHRGEDLVDQARGVQKEKLLAVHDITGGLSHPRVVVLEVAGQYFGYSRIRYLRQSESCGGTDQRTPFFKEREKAWRG